MDLGLFVRSRRSLAARRVSDLIVTEKNGREKFESSHASQKVPSRRRGF
jgi:hypothetical protein